jgi:RimJ/RimL family protein N-acetyltransferase
MSKYICFEKQVFSEEEFSIVPIRFKDRFKIMEWRNEQIYHLRQEKKLTELDQDNYFKETISRLFNQNKPDQILFSYLKNGECIGYGGLVHLNWFDKNAEISFLINTELEDEYFDFHWSIFLKLIESLAFDELSFHKIYVYAFDLRPQLYKVLLSSNYFRDAVLKDHYYFNNYYIDVVIHSKLNQYL